MGAAENRNKSQKQAEYMKAKGMTRTTGACPWGCGAQYSIVRANGLMEHLNKCRGGGARRLNPQRKGRR